MLIHWAQSATTLIIINHYLSPREKIVDAAVYPPFFPAMLGTFNAMVQHDAKMFTDRLVNLRIFA